MTVTKARTPPAQSGGVPASIHQLAAAIDGWVHARCGAKWDRRRHRSSLPDDVTGWHSRVTCPTCLSPPSWAAAGLPSKYPPKTP